MVDSAINVGNRPLHGKIVCDGCNQPFPWGINDSTGYNPCCIAPKSHAHGKRLLAVCAGFFKKLSRLKATRGKYPRSSSRVNKGKKMAIGGSITDTTHAKVLYIPKMRTPCSQLGTYFKTKPCKYLLYGKAP